MSVLLAAVAALIALAVAPPTRVSAHTGFESSTPSDGSTVAEPVTTVVVAFTGPAEPAGEGFVALDTDGTLRRPTSTEVTDQRIFTLTFDPALAGGVVGVRWSVRAPDTHPIEGSFAFEVRAPAPTTAAAPTTTLAPTTTAPASTVDGAAAVPTSSPDLTTVPSVPDTSGQGVSASDTPAPGNGSGTGTVTLDEFLAVDDSSPGETTALVGRVIGYPAIVIALGGLVFLFTTLVGRRDEVARGIFAVRLLGIVVVAGAAVEYVGVGQVVDESLGSAWMTSAGLAAALRAIAGIVLFVGLRAPARDVDPSRRPLALSASVADPGTVDDDLLIRGASFDDGTAREGPERVRWSPGTLVSAAAGAGVLALLSSFWFDGHTVSKGPRLLHATTNSIHVAAGSVWAGGVVALAVLLWSRRRRGQPGTLHELVVRFSGIATVSLVAVAAAGVVMSVFVLGSPGDLTGTEWGRLLLLKAAAVAVAAAIGAYNHFVLTPAIDRSPDDPGVIARIRSSVTAEAIVLTFVVLVTAWLVVANSS